VIKFIRPNNFFKIWENGVEDEKNSNDIINSYLNLNGLVKHILFNMAFHLRDFFFAFVKPEDRKKRMNPFRQPCHSNTHKK